MAKYGWYEFKRINANPYRDMLQYVLLYTFYKFVEANPKNKSEITPETN